MAYWCSDAGCWAVCPLVTTIMRLLSNSGFTRYSFFLIKRHKVRATGLTQVVLIPRLITYLCCYLLDQNGVRVRTRNNTDRVESSFDQSPSLISQSLFCAQGTRALAQVALAYLVVSGTFCFPGITSGTFSPGLVSKYRGRAPKGAIFVWTHSQRETWGVSFPHPTGSLTTRVLMNGGSAPPRVSTSFLVLHQSSPGTVRPLSHQLILAEPRALTSTRPLGHSPAFPHRDVKRVYLVDSFIARNPQTNAQTTSLALTLSGHTFSG